ncbi:hypothetical protein CRM22_008809 [Opisthorchis felineus]|uniref:Uncharacterized protein n=1 Tax=Opisthorchis felineus TaxID=147828 RepID=A0A4S2LA16_OPIFE|nr:hypothetical protein CRM22_008809 [Opisthorchis felineus]
MILGSQTILCLENDNVTMSSEISGHVSRYRFASTGLSLIKNENDIEIPKEEEGVFGDFEKDGDESASLAAEFPDHTADEDFQETTIASEETESHSAIVEEAKGDSASQAESLSDQLQDDERCRVYSSIYIEVVRCERYKQLLVILVSSGKSCKYLVPRISSTLLT